MNKGYGFDGDFTIEFWMDRMVKYYKGRKYVIRGFHYKRIS